MKKLIYFVFFVLLLGLTTPNIGQAAGEFKDLSPRNTFYDEIHYLSEKGVIKGFSDGSFQPNQPVTRAQAAIMLGRALGLEEKATYTEFSDVTAKVTGAGYIAAAVEKGIISGFPDGTYRPNDAVTRGQRAIFLDRAYPLEKGNENQFKDISSNMKAYQSILNVTATGIANGYPDGTYRPDLAVTRAQFSAFMARTLEPSFRDGFVYFSDKNFEKSIRDTLDKAEGPITVAEMERINKIEAQALMIKDISGIEYAKNLTYLDLGLNEIKDIEALAGLKKLRVLHMPSNQISDISALQDLKKLEIVDLSGNKITDISALKDLTEIFMLNLNVNEISDINALARLTKLTDLQIYGNQISDISVLSNFKTLYTLNVSYNKISDISVLEKLTTLQFLSLTGNQISDIDVLRNLTNLMELELAANEIDDISALGGLTKLTTLRLHENEITDISPLKELTGLKELSLGWNEIGDISVLGNFKNLTNLDLADDEISDIGVLSGLTKLEYLYLNENQITDITPISEHENLKYLSLAGNELNEESEAIVKELEERGIIVNYVDW